jgi:hypothetical protein
LIYLCDLVKEEEEEKNVSIYHYEIYHFVMTAAEATFLFLTIDPPIDKSPKAFLVIFKLENESQTPKNSDSGTLFMIAIPVVDNR